MSIQLQFACFLIAFILFVLSAAGVPSRVGLTAAGLAAWVLVPLVIAFNSL